MDSIPTIMHSKTDLEKKRFNEKKMRLFSVFEICFEKKLDKL